MIESMTLTCDEARFMMKAVISFTSGGINIYLGGGESPHIGTVVISQPRPSLRESGVTSCTTSVFNLLGHKDDEIAIPMAEKICKNTNRVVVVTAGIHIDHATTEDIDRLKMASSELTQKILQLWQEGK